MRTRFRIFISVLLLGLCLISSAEEIRESGLIGQGEIWETPYYVRDTGKEGPTVMIIGGVHGNEPAGARAAEQIRHWPIVRGKLIVLPRANVVGLERNMRFVPDLPENLQDLNRNFPGAKLEQGTRGYIAAAMWNLVTEFKPDWLFDLHEGIEFNISHEPKEGKSKSVGSSIIYYKGEELDPLARRMQAAVNATVSDPDRKFTLLGRGAKVTSFVNAAVRHLNIQGMILETTFSHQRLSVRTHQHRIMMNVLLNHLKVIEQDCVDVMVPTEHPDHTYVGVYDGEGASEKGIGNVVKILDSTEGITASHLRPGDIRSEVLAQFQAVVFSGGSGSVQAKSIGAESSDDVRSFVENGGGCLGICAGAFLCSAHYDWSLNLLDAEPFTGSREIEGVGKKQMWYRGKTSTQKMQLTEKGREIFTGIPENVEVSYHNGPIVSPKNFPGLKEYRPLAFYRTEQVLYPQQEGTMINTPAIIAGDFGKGRVIAISPHPEATEGLESMIPSAVRYVEGTR